MPATTPPSTADSLAQWRGLPNRVVVLTEAGSGAKVARDMAAEVERSWVELCREATTDSPPPGFPMVQWVCVPAGTGGYVKQWATAGAHLMARKRIRDFPDYRRSSNGGAPLCSLSGRWLAVNEPVRTSVRMKAGESLSVPALVKRRLGSRAGGFPSTLSVASAPFRAAVIDGADPDGLKIVQLLQTAVGTLCKSAGVSQGRSDLPGLAAEANPLAWLAGIEGAWLYPETWAPASLRRDHLLQDAPDAILCQSGLRAVHQLYEWATSKGINAPTPYLALVMQDADRMGMRLAHPPRCSPEAPEIPIAPEKWHHQVSEALIAAGRCQTAVVQSSAILGRTVYAGGDDMVAFVPAATALDAARRSYSAFLASLTAPYLVPKITASSAVMFFHAGQSLQAVVADAAQLLSEAKACDRPGLGIAVLRRGSDKARFTMPWHVHTTADGPPVSAVDLMTSLADEIGSGLSGSVASRLERDEAELDNLRQNKPEWWQRELSRRLGRQGGSPSAAAALTAMGLSGSPSLTAAVATMARFLSTQATETSRPREQP